jgi:hypothetical protein
LSSNTPKSGLTYPSLADPPNIPSTLSTLTNQLDGIVIPKYASLTAMNTANPTPTIGDMCFRTDLLSYMSYDGVAWNQVGPLGAWTPYAPAWTASTTNPTLGNGTLTGRYSLVGKTCSGQIKLTTGGTTSFGSGDWYFSLPFAAYETTDVHNIGYASGNRSAGAAQPSTFAYLRSPTTCGISPQIGDGGTGWSASIPISWSNTVTNRIYIDFRYETV